MTDKTLSRGTTLIEVLISLLILSVGILGMAGLQVVSLRNAQSAEHRTRVNILAADVAERLLANSASASALVQEPGAGLLSASCLTTAGCSEAAMVLHDLAEWGTAVRDGLPAGQGVVCLDSSPEDGIPEAPACDGVGRTAAVKTWWDDKRDGQPARRSVLRVRL